jgi:hypothetical protein
MKKWLWTPFVYVAGERALIAGWLIMLATACIAFFSQTHFNGVLDAHVSALGTFTLYFLEQFISWSSAVLMFYLIGRLYSHSFIRLIDVAGTLALSRAPLIFVALIGFAFPRSIDIRQMDAVFIGLVLVELVFIIWMVALMYNAFTVSCNLKGSRGAGLFIAALLLSEILSKFLFYLIYKPVSGS